MTAMSDDASIAMGAALDRIKELEDALIEASTGSGGHLYLVRADATSQRCPALHRPWDRDPNCPACQRLERLLGHRRPTS